MIGLSRRMLLAAGGGLAWGRAAQASQSGAAVGDPDGYLDGRLLARLAPPTRPFDGGTENLGLDRRDALLFAPERRDPTTTTPLVIALHGAGGTGRDMIDELRREARRRNFAVVAPTSRSLSWRLRNGPVGPDAAFIDLSLQATFDRIVVDPRRIAILGMSDGASYALSLGLANGDRFSDVIAMEPLYFNTPTTIGRARFFLSIGRRDTVSGFSNVVDMADKLRTQGFDVELAKHRGGHVLDRGHLERAVDRLLS